MSPFEQALQNSNARPLQLLIIGCGVVGKGVLAGLQRHLRGIRGTIVDQQPAVIAQTEAEFLPAFPNPANHWTFETVRVDADNYAALLERLTAPGGIVVETCVEVNTAEILRWCLAHGRHFTNTVCDLWKAQTLAKTDHYRQLHGILRDYVTPVVELIRATPADRPQPTCVVGNGANIGMVNHYFKQALADAARHWGAAASELAAELAGVYIYEKDTLVFRRGFVPHADVFYNTWNVLEFHLESVAHVDYPALSDGDAGVRHRCYTRAMARDLQLADHLLHGRVVAHEETYSIADYLQRRHGRHPEIQFLYECSPIGEISRIRLPLGAPYTPVCVATEADPAHGSDLVGTLIVLRDGRAWSTGFDCRQDDLDPALRPFTNATAWYVSCGILAALLLIREYPDAGPGFPEDFDGALNTVAIRNFEGFVSPVGRRVVSRDESGLARLSAAYPTYECENRHGAPDPTASLLAALDAGVEPRRRAETVG